MPGDPYFRHVKSLLPFDAEAAGADPYWANLVGYADLTKDIAAELGTAFTIVGAPYIAEVEGRNAMVFNGSSAVYFTAVGAFNTTHTIEFELYVASITVPQRFFGISDTATGSAILLGVSSSAYWTFATQNGPATSLTDAPLATVGWHTVALSYTGGGQSSLFIDGVRVNFYASVAAGTTPWKIIILGRNNTTYAGAGSAIRKLRAYRDVALYTDPTYPVVEKGKGRIATDECGPLWFESGAPALAAGSFFGASSMRLDGSGYIARAGFPTIKGDFTTELFVRLENPAGGVWQRLVGQYLAGGWAINVDPDGMVVLNVRGAADAAPHRSRGERPLVAGQWHHIAIVRYGALFAVFVDGSVEACAYNTGDMVTGLIAIGTQAESLGGSLMAGNVGSFRHTAQLARYTPVAADPNIGSVSFAQRFSGGTQWFVDSDHGVTFTNANVVPAACTTPFGTAGYAAKFNGAASFLTTSFTTPGAGDFALEVWVQVESDSTGPILARNTAPVTVYFSVTRTAITFYNNSVVIATVPVALDSGWHHIVFCRSASELRIYADGAVLTAVPYADSVYFGTCRIGRNLTTGEWFKGLMADLRFTSGVARYTGASYQLPTDYYPRIEGSFTPPSAPFPLAATAVSGVVLDSDDTPCARKVFAYSHANGRLLGEAVSDPTTGAFSIAVPERCFAVVLDDDVSGKNALVFDRLDPV